MYIETRKGVITMIIKDLLTNQYVALYNSCGILEWEGEFKHVPHRYFECIIANMYSSSANDRGSCINIKKNYTRREKEVRNITLKEIFRLIMLNDNVAIIDQANYFKYWCGRGTDIPLIYANYEVKQIYINDDNCLVIAILRRG